MFIIHNMLSKKFKKYIEVFMWCLLIFGVAFPSLRFQQLTIERTEADARRMSTIKSNSHTIQHVLLPNDRRIQVVHNYDIAYKSSEGGKRVLNSTSTAQSLPTPSKNAFDLSNDIIATVIRIIITDRWNFWYHPSYPKTRRGNRVYECSVRLIQHRNIIIKNHVGRWDRTPPTLVRRI